MVNIAQTPLNQRIKETSDKLYTAASQAGPGEVPLPVEVFEETIDLLQALIDVRTEQAEDLESAYESVGAEIEESVGLMQKLETMTKTADGLANKVLDLQDKLDVYAKPPEKATLSAK